MESAKSLLLNESALVGLKNPDAQKPVFLFEWLRNLESLIPTLPKKDLKDNQKALVSQLLKLIQKGSPGGPPGPPARELIGRCLTALFTVGDTFLLFETINNCNDLLKNKDDSPSYLPTRLAAICVLGHMYESLGRMTGRSYVETIQVLIKGLKNAESQTRLETMKTFGKVCIGLGSAAINVHRDVYKCLRSVMSSDRVMAVRAAAASAILAMASSATFLTTTELENVATMCFKAFDGANYVTRKAIANCLGEILAMTQSQNLRPREGMMMQIKKSNNGANKSLPLEDALAILMQGFLKGGSGSGLIKGSSPVSQEVRVGVTHCYVTMVQALGTRWLEKHMSTLLNHVLDLVSQPKAASTHVDAVYSRRCVGFTVQILLGKLLGEKAQLSACKEIVLIVDKLMSSIDTHSENAKDSGNAETIYSQHQIVVAMQELGTLFQRLGTSCRFLLGDNHLRLTEVLLSVLLHPCQAPRLAAAYCLRSLCIAVPSHLTPTIDICLEGLEKFKSSTEAVAGYSGAIAALLGAVRHTPLGIPHTRGKFIFNVGEELLRTASQNSRLSRERTQAGWILIGSIMTLGPAVVKGLLPRMLLLWRNAFPRSQKELDSEKARGDAFTWRISLEARAGAMASIHAFLQNATNNHTGSISSQHFDLINDDILRRLSVPLEACLNLCVNMGPVIKSYPTELKALAAMLRLRLYETLTLLPPSLMEGSFTQLLRMLVGEFTLSEGQSTSTSLLRTLCHSEDSVILGTHFQDTEESVIEEQLLTNSASGSGALEHDICSLYRSLSKECSSSTPGPLPLGVSVVDQSIVVFGLIFPHVAQKHRLQMLQHFSDQIKHAQTGKAAKNSEAVQLNIFTAVLCSLKGMVEAKATFGGQAEVKKAAVNLILGALTSPNAMLRCAAGEALGRMAQVVSDARFVAETAQTSFDCLKSTRDVTTRTGHSLALGCLHRYVGGMGSAQHLNTSVSILLALAQDIASPEVQVWALHALALIADSGGPMFRSFVEPTLETSLKLLLTISPNSLEVFSCLGRVLSALITTIGPELQGGANQELSSFSCACAILQRHIHPVIQSEALKCLQQLHMFTGNSFPQKLINNGIDLNTLVPYVCSLLKSSHLILRKASISCLRQFAQREARELCDIAIQLINDESSKSHEDLTQFSESGLPGILFSTLDHELDLEILSNVHDTLTFLMQATAAENLSMWLTLLREVLTVSTDSGGLDGGQQGQKNLLDDEKDEDNAGGDTDQFTTVEEVRDIIQPRWPTRVFAAECLRKIISECCQGNRAHYDIVLAKEIQMTSRKGDFLALHLSELVRVAFMASTSESDPLRLEGLRTLEEVINKFGSTPEPEYPGHVILEQYQAQVGAALRPAFTPDTPSHVTAAACNVCSTWIGSGVARELSDLRRVYQLLVTSLDKIKPKSNSQLYNESALTLEKLSILQGWAQVYTVSMKNEVQTSVQVPDIEEDDDFGDFEMTSSNNSNLASLVQSELPSLSKFWLAALRDHAMLNLPPEFKSQLPYDGGAFYTNDTIESARPHYKSTWAPILKAAAIWLTYGQGFDNVRIEKSDLHSDQVLGLTPTSAMSSKSSDDINQDRFFLLFGICMEALANTRSADLRKEEVTNCLEALKSLLYHSWCRKQVLAEHQPLLIELCNALHRTVLTRDHSSIQILVVEVLQLVLAAAKDGLEHSKKQKQKEMELPANQEPQNHPELDFLGEGGQSGVIDIGKSVVFATLEVGLCVLVRHYPEISPRAANLNSVMAMQAKSRLKGRLMTEEQCLLISQTLRSLSMLPNLCSPMGALNILPSVLWLIIGVLKETSWKTANENSLILSSNVQTTAALQSLKDVAMSPYAKDSRSKLKWSELMQSSLLRILDLAKTAPGDEEDHKLDETSILLAITVFILHGPPESLTSPNIVYPSINAFTQGLQSENVSIKIRTVQTLQTIFHHESRAVVLPYIQSLAPRIFGYLLEESSREVKTELELKLTLECLNLVDILVLSLDEAEKKSQILNYQISILVSELLKPEHLKEASNLKLKLHDLALAKLTRIGQIFPDDFKHVLSSNPELKSRLESAVKANQIKMQNERQRELESGIQVRKVQDHKPSIQLKMDFSNFAMPNPK